MPGLKKSAEQSGTPHNLMMTLSVSGEMRQNSSSSSMIRKIPQIIAEASQFFMPGDVVLTGTPQGVGQIVSGDQIIVSIEQVGTLNVSVA
jgi:2-keto-4-pentenoate hydratase/2-oxohepta-3-ene-1,7-dioic acid hydratase in catechol pathway